MERGAPARLDAMDPRLQIFAMIRVADALRRDQQIRFAIVGDERKNIVVAQLIDRHRGGLARFLELGAFHRAAAIEHDTEVHRRAPGFIVLARFNLDLHDHFARAKPVNKIAFRRDP